MAPGLSPDLTFTFDANAHKYYVGGVEVPGVTKILHESGLAPAYHGSSDAAWRGTRVHEACELLDLDDLDWTELGARWPGEWVKMVRAYERFKLETGFVPELIEHQAYHPQYRFAGTLDRRGLLNGEQTLIDFKTGQEEKWHKYQTAGYQILGQWREGRRGCLYLRGDGQYLPRWHDKPNDLRVFMSALTITHEKMGSL